MMKAARMSDLKSIWSKVDGSRIVGQIAREHMVASTSLTVAACGVSRKGLEIVRDVMSLKLYRRISKKMQADLPSLKVQIENEYQQGEVKRNNTIWTLWLQGEGKAPYIVRECISSMRDNLPEKQVVVLDQDSFGEYCKLPQHVLEKYKNGVISRTHLSDLLRLELLCTKGGTWIDSTVWLSGKPPAFMTDSRLFLFQNLKPGLDGKSISMSSWWITAQAPSKVLLLTRALLYRWWEKYNRMDDYFLIHYLMQLAIDCYPDEWGRVVPASNGTPHCLLLRLGDTFDKGVYEGLCEQSSVHKLTYKNVEQFSGQDTYLNHIFPGFGAKS